MSKTHEVMFYTDGRHTSVYLYEPPMGVKQYVEPIDELLDQCEKDLMNAFLCETFIETQLRFEGFLAEVDAKNISDGPSVTGAWG